jgi:glucose-6-phosphate dehydrogenase assembly protein OpcA
VATTLTDTTLSAVERALADQRPPNSQRTSVLTHLVWAPPKWLRMAEQVLAGMEEEHPSRTVIMTPEPRRKEGLDARVNIVVHEVEDTDRFIAAEVIELRLKGSRSRAPGSIAVPLLIPDLPAFCRWRGEPAWGSPELEQLASAVDRLIVDSTEWTGLPAANRKLAGLFDRVAVSDLAWTRTVAWRARLAALWPGIKRVKTLEVTGPQGEALLLAGWLRSRLHKRIGLEWRPGRTLRRVAVDGTRVEPPTDDPLSASELLSSQLDVFGRDPIYEAAVRAATR